VLNPWVAYAEPMRTVRAVELTVRNLSPAIGIRRQRGADGAVTIEFVGRVRIRSAVPKLVSSWPMSVLDEDLPRDDLPGEGRRPWPDDADLDVPEAAAGSRELDVPAECSVANPGHG
jgi:hypothetical protein